MCKCAVNMTLSFKKLAIYFYTWKNNSSLMFFYNNANGRASENCQSVGSCNSLETLSR